MNLENVDVDVDAFDNVQTIGLEDERVARMVEHPRRALELPRIIESMSNRFPQPQQQVLREPKMCQVQHARNTTLGENLTIRERPLEILLQAPPSLIHIPAHIFTIPPTSV